MDTRLRQAVAKIEVRHDGAVTSRGTGTLVAPGLVLTALHVVGDRNSDPTEFYPGEIHLTFPDHTTRAAPVEGKWDRNLDWALLRCEQEPDIVPAPLGDLSHGGQDWTTYGFPDAQPIDGMVQAGRVRNVDARLGGQPTYQLFSEDAAAGDGAPVKGLSGGPVFVDGALVGVLRFALMKEGQAVAGTLYACPTHVVADVCGGLLPIPDPCRGLPGLPHKPLPEQPFRFLARYDADDAEIFFGRNRQIHALYELITDPGTADVILLYGQTGVGKSSFLDAGLVPRLQWRYAVRYIRRELGCTLLQTLRRTLREAAAGQDPGPHAELPELWMAAEAECRRPLGILLDQVEEVYTRTGTVGDDEILELGAALAHAFGVEGGPRGRLVLSFRKEWYPEIQKRLEERGVDFARVFLEALDTEGIMEAVTGLTSTARLRNRYGLAVARELPRLIANQLEEDRDSPIAPTLQILLTKLWEEATKTNDHAPQFTTELYRHLKEDGLLLGDFLDQQIEALHARHARAVTSGLVLDVLARHTTPLLTADECPVRELVADYGHHSGFAELLAEMQDLYILVDAGCDRRSGESITRLSHDTLAPHVRQLFDESMHPGQAAARIIQSRMTEDDDASDAAPLGPRTLEVVERGLAGMRALRPVEERLIAVSRAARDRALRTRRRIKVAFVTLMVVLAAATVYSAYQRRLARIDQRKTELSNTTDRVRSDLRTSPQTGLLHAFNAVCDCLEEGFPLVAELQMSLSEAVEQAREQHEFDIHCAVYSLAVQKQEVDFERDAAVVGFAAGCGNGEIRIFDLDGNETLPAYACYPLDEPCPPRLREHEGKYSVRALAYVDGGRALLAACRDGVLREFSSVDPGIPPVLRRLESESAPDRLSSLTSLAVSADGSLYATGAEDGTVVVWLPGSTEPHPVQRPEGGPSRVNGVVFIPRDRHRDAADRGVIGEEASLEGARRLAAVDDSGRILLWDVAADGSSGPPQVVVGGQGPIRCIAARRAPSGEAHFATGGQDRTIRVYLRNGEPLRRPNYPRKSVDEAQLIELTQRNKTNVIIDAHDAPVVSIVFDTLGEFVMSGDREGVVMIHTHRGQGAARPFRGLDGAATALAYSGPRSTLIASRDGRIRVRDSRGLVVRRDLRALDNEKVQLSDPRMGGVAINREGTRLATMSYPAPAGITREGSTTSEATEHTRFATVWRRDPMTVLHHLSLGECTAGLRDALFVVPGPTELKGKEAGVAELVVTGCDAGHVHVWERSENHRQSSVARSAITCIDVDNDAQARWLAVGAEAGEVWIFDLQSDGQGQEASYLVERPRAAGAGPRPPIHAVALSADARVLAISVGNSSPDAADAVIEIWERRESDHRWHRRTKDDEDDDENQVLDRFDHGSNHGIIFGLALSPDSETLYSVGQDGKIRGRDLYGRNRFHAQKAHLGGARSIDISDSGDRLITGGNDGRVVLWRIGPDRGSAHGKHDAETKQHCARIAQLTPDHPGEVRTVSFGGPHDAEAMSGGTGGAARLWRVHPATWLEIAAQRLVKFVAKEGASGTQSKHARSHPGESDEERRKSDPSYNAYTHIHLDAWWEALGLPEAHRDR